MSIDTIPHTRTADNAVDRAWEQVRLARQYGVGLEEATRNGMDEYLDYLAERPDNTEVIGSTPELHTALVRRDPKELARIAFTRGGGRQQDHGTRDNSDRYPLTEGPRARRALDQQAHIDTFAGETHIPIEISPDTKLTTEAEIKRDEILAEYDAWLENEGMVNTTSNLERFLNQVGSLQTRQVELSGSILEPVEEHERQKAIDEALSELTPSIYSGYNELTAKLGGLRASYARQAATEATYNGGSPEDDDPIDWYPSATIR